MQISAHVEVVAAHVFLFKACKNKITNLQESKKTDHQEIQREMENETVVFKYMYFSKSFHSFVLTVNELMIWIRFCTMYYKIWVKIHTIYRKSFESIE